MQKHRDGFANDPSYSVSVYSSFYNENEDVHHLAKSKRPKILSNFEIFIVVQSHTTNFNDRFKSLSLREKHRKHENFGFWSILIILKIRDFPTFTPKGENRESLRLRKWTQMHVKGYEYFSPGAKNLKNSVMRSKLFENSHKNTYFAIWLKITFPRISSNFLVCTTPSKADKISLRRDTVGRRKKNLKSLDRFSKNYSVHGFFFKSKTLKKAIKKTRTNRDYPSVDGFFFLQVIGLCVCVSMCDECVCVCVCLRIIMCLGPNCLPHCSSAQSKISIRSYISVDNAFINGYCNFRIYVYCAVFLSKRSVHSDF